PTMPPVAPSRPTPRWAGCGSRAGVLLRGAASRAIDRCQATGADQPIELAAGLLTRLDPSEALLVPANAAPAFDQLRAQLRSTLVPSLAGLDQPSRFFATRSATSKHRCD
ncbi:MAG: hypothetical protein ACK5V0_05630, partial [Alphaproteobacteria bacterium]